MSGVLSYRNQKQRPSWAPAIGRFSNASPARAHHRLQSPTDAFLNQKVSDQLSHVPAPLLLPQIGFVTVGSREGLFVCFST